MCASLFSPNKFWVTWESSFKFKSGEWWRLEVKQTKKPKLCESKTKSHKMSANLNSMFARWRLWRISRIWSTSPNIQELAESRNAIHLRNEWMNEPTNHEWIIPWHSKVHHWGVGLSLCTPEILQTCGAFQRLFFQKKKKKTTKCILGKQMT